MNAFSLTGSNDGVFDRSSRLKNEHGIYLRCLFLALANIGWTLLDLSSLGGDGEWIYLRPRSHLSIPPSWEPVMTLAVGMVVTPAEGGKGKVGLTVTFVVEDFVVFVVEVFVALVVEAFVEVVLVEVVFAVDDLFVVVAAVAGRHWLYHSLETTHSKPELHSVDPVYPWLPLD
jgi:hypothetical protein